MKQFESITNKISRKSDLMQILSFYKFKNYKIVFTNGCFDILHRGHIEYLSKASDFGDVLIIGLNTDDSVKRLKGVNRPINDEISRAINLAALKFVDNVVYFEEDTPYDLIGLIQPNVLIKGSDYKIKDIVGSDIVLNNGGTVETIDFVTGFSTTDLISKIHDL